MWVWEKKKKRREMKDWRTDLQPPSASVILKNLFNVQSESTEMWASLCYKTPIIISADRQSVCAQVRTPEE